MMFGAGCRRLTTVTTGSDVAVSQKLKTSPGALLSSVHQSDPRLEAGLLVGNSVVRWPTDGRGSRAKLVSQDEGVLRYVVRNAGAAGSTFPWPSDSSSMSLRR